VSAREFLKWDRRKTRRRFRNQEHRLGERRAGNSRTLQMKSYIDVVGNLDERDSFVHPITLPVKDDGPLNLAGAGPLTRNSKCEFSGLETSRVVKIPSAS